MGLTRSSTKHYFSFRSPYCWLLVERLLRERPDELSTWDNIPYWEPSEVEAPGSAVAYRHMSREKHLYILQDIKRQAMACGFQVKWPVDRGPWWAHPHLAYLAVRKSGAGDAFLVEVFRRRFLSGQDIFVDATLFSVAEELGIPASLVGREELLGNSEILEEARLLLAQSGRDGVFGIPFLLQGRDRFWGLDRLDLFLESRGTGEVLARSAG